MQEMSFEDNGSLHSNDSSESITTVEDKLKELVNMELKHSGVYYDLHSKDNLLKVDFENLCVSSQRFEVQKKKKNESLEKYYEELVDIQKRNKIEMEKKLSKTTQKIETFNSVFCEAFHKYSSGVLKCAISSLNGRMKTVDADLKEVTKYFDSQYKEEITKVLMTPKSSVESKVESIKNFLFQVSIKRSEIDLETNIDRLTREIQSLESKKKEIQSWISQ